LSGPHPSPLPEGEGAYIPRIGVDVGGTFTDLALIAAGRLLQVKVPTVPDDPASGVLAAVEAAASELGVSMADLLGSCGAFVHGTTIGTNALLMRRGPTVGLLATEGFRDTLAMRRGHRDDVWAFRTADPPPLVQRALRLGVRERIGPSGQVLTPLEPASVRAAAAAFRASGVQAVAIGFLFGYLNPEHERAAAAIVADELPGVFVTCSHQVSPAIGEYERIATTVVNAFLGPTVARYLADLSDRLAASGLRAPLLIAQSSGGVADVARSRRLPAGLALSGPGAGIAAARAFAGWLAAPNLVSVDMGGTSFDVGVVAEGAVGVRQGTEIGGQHVALPTVDVHTIGTGGGSLARVDSGGVLRVGPEGAGARPGPACYGRGGDRPTVTDANLVLGRLDPEAFLGGRMRLDLAAARRVVERDVAAPLGLSLEAAARGIVSVATAQMADAIRVMTVERGLDPRDFTLLAAGGATALHVGEIARALGIRRAIVPRAASVYCALGMLVAELSEDRGAPFYGALDALELADLQAVVDRLSTEGASALAGLGFAPEQIVHRASVDARYAGRHREHALALPGHRLTEVGRQALRSAFDELSARRYGHADRAASVEIAQVRVTSAAPAPEVSLPIAPAAAHLATGVPSASPLPLGEGQGEGVPGAGRNAVPLGKRRAVLGGAAREELPVYDGARLGRGDVIEGPAIVEDAATTTLLWPGDRLEVDHLGGYLIAIGGGDA
jgi:N-methylhydantoinase A